MFQVKGSFSSFSVDDLTKAKEFYGEVLGLEVKEMPGMGLDVQLPGTKVFIYSKKDHQPAAFTVLNLVVSDIDASVDELKTRGVKFEHYEGELKTDEKGIARGQESGQGPDIAWFKDPAGNFLAVLEEK